MSGQANGAEHPPAGDPLRIARQYLEDAARIGDRAAADEARDPGWGWMAAEARGDGQAQYHAVRMAGYLAAISIAQDLRRIADTLTVVDAEIVEDAPEVRG